MTEPRDEKHSPDEPDATTTPDPPTEPIATPGPTAPAGPAGPTGPTGRDRVAAVMGSRWLPPLATGLAGLMLGLMIGLVGMVVIAGIAFSHGPRGHHGPGDGRGHHWQDDRPAPPQRR